MMYSFESSGSRKPLHAMVVGALIGTAVLFCVGGMEGMPFPFLFQTAAVLCATIAIYLTAGYSLKSYRYAIEPNTIVDAEGLDQYDLVITEIRGKRMKVVARVGLRSVDHDAVVVIRRSDGEAAKDARNLLCKGKQVFRYENTPLSPASCYIPIPEENSVIVIPVDDRMVEILKGK
ncbi:MAG: hypothetical protein IKM33_02270 [Clostridia bacterium]|nr:hypothetical protein [Clostridia bacterium]